MEHPSENSSFSVLIVDDEVPVLEGMVRVLENQGYQVSGVKRGEEAIELFRQHPYDLVVTDLRLEGMDGLEVLRRVKEIDEEIPVLIMTGFGTMESAIEAVRLGASDYLTKPVRAPELTMAVRNQLSALRLRRQVKELNRQIAEERDKLREAVAELNLLTRLADRMMTALSYLEGYDLLINFLLEEMGSDLAAIYICDRNQLRFNGKYALGEKVRQQIHQLISQWLISLGKEGLVPSSHEPLFSTSEDISPEGEPSEEVGMIRSSISVPIVIDDLPFGLLIAASFSDSNFETKWGRFVHQVARSASEFLTRVRRSVESQQYLTSAIVEHTGDGLVVVNFTENRVLLNPAAQAMLKIPVGVDPRIETIQERLEVDLKSLWQDLHSHGEEPAKRRTIIRQVNIYDHDRTICLRMVISRIPETASGQGSMLLSLQDLTQEREVEEMKSRLVSNISHELRTPTSVVKEFIALLKDGVAGELTEHQKQILDIMKANVDRLGRLVENLLTLARADTGGFNVVLRTEHLEPIIDQVVLSMTPKLQQKQITLKVNLPPDIPQVYADRDAIIQVLTNLIDNARKYSPEQTTVTLSLQVKGDRVELAVADQGYGIPLSQIENIFKRFTRLVDQEDPRFQEGVGLGLPVVKELITRHGGDIWVESEEGNGSTFYFTLQIAKGTEEMRPA